MAGELLLELATYAALVGAVPDVEAMSLRVTHDEVPVREGDHITEWASVVSVEIHTASLLDAHCLMDRLGFVSEPARTWDRPGAHGQEPRRWRQWAGWATSASHDIPVSVAVTASAAIPAGDEPYDPTDDPWSREHNAAEAVPAGAVA